MAFCIHFSVLVLVTGFVVGIAGQNTTSSSSSSSSTTTSGGGGTNSLCDSANGWYGDDDIATCFYLGEEADGADDEVMDWFGALDYCGALREGAFLAEIRTQAENDFIRVELGGLPDEHLWIAANDLTDEGVWEFGIGSGDAVVYENWSPNTDPPQPDNRAGNEDCAVMNGDDSFYWYDVNCTNLYKPLCEYVP